MRYFPLECLADQAVYARIKRFDGLFYNQYSQEFENDPNLMIDLVQSEGLIWTANIELTDEEFPPGKYSVYYHGFDGTIKGSYVDLPNKTTPSDIAERVARIQIGDGSLRFAINKMSKQMDEILKLLKSNNLV